MPKRKEPELDPKEQFKRFKEAAEAAGVTRSETEFEHAFRTVTSRKSASAKPERPRKRKS